MNAGARAVVDGTARAENPARDDDERERRRGDTIVVVVAFVTLLSGDERASHTSLNHAGRRRRALSSFR